MLVGKERASALAHAAIFVLPTYSENFGMVIAEALAHGTPVITTQAAPWREILDERCGWWIRTGPEALRAALLEALAVQDASRREMGMRGRALMERRYSWQQVASEMTAAYEWLTLGGRRPDFVHD
jgi:glycosyltransferase involved in cell wall biosynthesis